MLMTLFIFFFQAEDGIRDRNVTGVQTCALPISADDVLQAVNEKEAELDAPEEETTEATSDKILAVTACPTGIAHTYMAAEKLSETAKDMDITVKVETNGSSGVKNRLTNEEIAEADTIIVA